MLCFPIHQFVTEGYSLTLFMKLTNMDTIDDTPNGFPETAKAKTKLEWLKRQVRNLVDSIFNPASQDDMKLVAEAVRQCQLDDDDDDAIALDDLYAYCICKEGAGKFLNMQLS